jgi:Protein of unknown function (DUF3738)
MLMMSYDVKNYQVSGPDWLNTERYDVTAKVGDGATKEQVQAMWRNLLAERFGVALHHESKELQLGRAGGYESSFCHTMKSHDATHLRRRQADPETIRDAA